jgi:two-component system alkaline phosphatase synthesis response regulator PhoP
MARILVVDDEPDIVEIVRFRLEQDGHEVLTASDGRTGFAMAFTQQPDLTILDVMMPGISGFEVLYQIKHAPRTANMPVIMLTAKTDLGSISKGWEMEVDNYVTKPFNVDDLANTVKDVLIFRGKMPAD